MSRGKIIFIIFILFVSLVAVYLKRDLALTGIIGKKLPPIMVEHLDFARVINGREWRVKAENAESEGDEIRASSLDIIVSDPVALRSANIVAARGVFSQEQDTVRLFEVAGVVYLENRSVDVMAPRVDYDVSEDVWFFSEGVSASDDKTYVTGHLAKIDSSGTVNLGKGAYASWKLE